MSEIAAGFAFDRSFLTVYHSGWACNAVPIGAPPSAVEQYRPVSPALTKIGGPGRLAFPDGARAGIRTF